MKIARDGKVWASIAILAMFPLDLIGFWRDLARKKSKVYK